MYSSTAARTAVREYVHAKFVAVLCWYFHVFTTSRHTGDRRRLLSPESARAALWGGFGVVARTWGSGGAREQPGFRGAYRGRNSRDD